MKRLNAKFWYFSSFLFIFVIFILCFIKRATDLPIADEFNMVVPLETWVQRGPEVYGMWHSPYYMWIMMAVCKVFGFSTAIARSVGYVTTVFTALLLWLSAQHIQRTLSPQSSTLNWRLWCTVFLALLSPVALGSALLIDYDNTILMLATALYFYLLLFFENAKSQDFFKVMVVFTTSIAFCFMGKESTPFIYPVGILTCFAGRWGWGKAFVLATLTGILGFALFFLTTWGWATFYHLPVFEIFRTDLMVLDANTSSQAILPWSQKLWIKITPALWWGLPLTGFFLMQLRSLLTTSHAGVRGIATTVVSVLFVYTFVLNQRTFHFPKYMSPVLLWVPWLILWGSKQPTQTTTRSISENGLWLWTACTIAWFLIAPDHLQVLHSRTIADLLVGQTVVFFPLVMWTLFGTFKSTTAKRPPLWALILMTTIGLSATYGREALLSTKSITFWYGDRALQEAQSVVSTWVQAHPQGLVYIPARDLYYVTRSWGSIDLHKDPLSGLAPEICGSRKPVLIVTRIREDSSLLSAPEFAAFRKCLQIELHHQIVTATTERSHPY